MKASILAAGFVLAHAQQEEGSEKLESRMQQMFSTLASDKDRIVSFERDTKKPHLHEEVSHDGKCSDLIRQSVRGKTIFAQAAQDYPLFCNQVITRAQRPTPQSSASSPSPSPNNGSTTNSYRSAPVTMLVTSKPRTLSF